MLRQSHENLSLIIWIRDEYLQEIHYDLNAGEITGESRSARRRNSDKRRKFRPVGEILKLRQGRILKMVDWRSLTLFPRSSMRNVEGRGGTRGIEGARRRRRPGGGRKVGWTTRAGWTSSKGGQKG